MSTNSHSQSVNPAQDLLDRIIEVQKKLEDLGSSIRNNRVQSQYEHVRTKIADTKTAITGLVNVFDRYGAS